MIHLKNNTIKDINGICKHLDKKQKSYEFKITRGSERNRDRDRQREMLSEVTQKKSYRMISVLGET